MTNKINLQDAFLEALKKAKAAVNIYLLNGVKLQGIVKDYDNFTVLFTSMPFLRFKKGKKSERFTIICHYA